jgi:hypothetical protein
MDLLARAFCLLTLLSLRGICAQTNEMLEAIKTHSRLRDCKLLHPYLLYLKSVAQT